MDINDWITWLTQMALLEFFGLLDHNDDGARLAFVGDAIPGETYGG
jgi:hypothetical protein